jgi:hypothetical protein
VFVTHVIHGYLPLQRRRYLPSQESNHLPLGFFADEQPVADLWVSSAVPGRVTLAEGRGVPDKTGLLLVCISMLLVHLPNLKAVRDDADKRR